MKMEIQPTEGQLSALQGNESVQTLGAWPDVALVSVKHNGTRYVRDHLIGWDIPVIQIHIEHVTNTYSGRQVVIPIRNTYMCFLTWWKNIHDARDEPVILREFLNAWHKLDEWIDSLEIDPVIFFVDRQNIQDLAALAGVPYTPIIDRGQSAHYICDKYIQPRKEAFPQEIRDIAQRWGY